MSLKIDPTKAGTTRDFKRKSSMFILNEDSAREKRADLVGGRSTN